jgi:hypothetical protein
MPAGWPADRDLKIEKGRTAMTGRTGRLRLALGAMLLALAISGCFTGVSLAQAGKGLNRAIEQHICEADHGVIIEQRGTATCSADATSYAIAIGTHAEAHATEGGTATATGVRSYASAGSGGTATAIGSRSYATAHIGIATATGTSSRAQAVDFDSSATATGNRSFASAVNGGTATSEGTSTHAHAGGTGSQALAVGNGSSAEATGINASAEATGGGTATAAGVNSTATATGKCEAYAEADDTDVCSGP